MATSGSLQDHGVIELVQRLGLLRHVGVLELRSAGERGRIAFEGGTIRFASTSEHLGTAAFYYLCSWAEGTFNVLQTEDLPEPNIFASSNDALILEALMRLEAARSRWPPGAPDPVMDLARADEELKLPYKTNLYLEVVKGPDIGLRVQFTRGNVVIGRSNKLPPKSDIGLTDDGVSRRHALIEAYTRDKIFIKDLASTNGTYVNGTRITYDKLKPADKIRVGTTVMQFQLEEVP